MNVVVADRRSANDSVLDQIRILDGFGPPFGLAAERRFCLRTDQVHKVVVFMVTGVTEGLSPPRRTIGRQYVIDFGNHVANQPIDGMIADAERSVVPQLASLPQRGVCRGILARIRAVTLIDVLKLVLLFPYPPFGNGIQDFLQALELDFRVAFT